MSNEQKSSGFLTAAQLIPPSSRSAYDIPKPKDWQEFQRKCLVLFKLELADRHGTEYGRIGQEQYGIDLQARRNGAADHLVGVQCDFTPSG